MVQPLSPEVLVSRMGWGHVGKPILRMAVCIAVVFAITVILDALPLRDRPFSAAFVFLFLVLIISAVWGFRYAVFVSLIAALGFSWLGPPSRNFSKNDSRDVFALIEFLVIGIIASYLSDRARRAALNANQRRAEAVAAQKRFADLVNSVEGIVWEADPQTFVFSFVSEQAERILGYPTEKWLHEPTFWKDHLHPEDRDWTVQFCVQATAEKRSHDFEYRMIAADGRVVWMRDLVTVVVENGRPIRLRGVMVDVTQRKQNEVALREQANVLSLTHDAILIRDLTGTIKDWNRGAEELYGWSKQQAIGKLAPDLLKTVFPVPLEQIHADVLRTGRWEGELVRTKIDGTQVVVAARWSLQPSERGAPVAIVETNNDVTERKRAESLLAGEKRVLEMVAKGESLAEILEAICRLVEEQASGVLASILLLDGNRLRHGGAPSLPKAYTEAIDGAVIGPSVGSCGTAAHRGKQVIVEDIATDPLWADYRDLALSHCLRSCWSTPVFSSQGKVMATFAMYYRDPRRPSRAHQVIIEQITHLAGMVIEHKLTQDRLRRSESYLAEAQRLSRTGSWAFDPGAGKMVYWSEEMFRIWGFDPQQPPPDVETLWQRIHPEDLERMRPLLENGLRGELKSHVVKDHRIVLPDGTLKHIHGTAQPVFNQSGEVVQYVGTAVDVTEHKYAEDALGAAYRDLEAREAKIRRLVNTDVIGILEWDLDGRIIDANETFLQIVGYNREDIASGRLWWTNLTPAEWREQDERLTAQLKLTGFLRPYEKEYLRKDGTRVPVLISTAMFEGSSKEGVAYVVDLTERKRAEKERERLQQVEADLAHINRVSMMGELAASLAHEIKQPIAAAATDARTSLRWLQRKPPEIEEAREAASRVVCDVNRAADIINHLRSLYKKGAPTGRELLDVNELIEEMIVLLRNEANRYSISIRSDLTKSLPQATADRVQLQQVLMNLMLNGIEAMKERAGELTIKSQQTEGGQLLISISDTGVGLPTENLEQIFNAFFTTKPQGTGMGLAISRSIIEAHRGRLWATANSGRGATFQFTLPTEVMASSSSAARKRW